ncbi:MAG: Rid family detoxifying hydrolase [Carnobacterium sp.]|uniref:Rid family detoxifying hydrolase n=1 Tax=Carnobacterium sp. TaxID=48221 RepID=UPI002FCC9341
MLETIYTENAPKPIGPYAQAIKVGEFVYPAGQIGVDPATGQLVEGSIKEQAKQALLNLSAVLEEAGSSLDQVVKTTCYLSTMENFQEFNEAFGEQFAGHEPARTCFAVQELPLKALCEIEVVAVVKK